MADNRAYLAFLADPDQPSRRAELADFCGPHAETFLRAYDKLLEDTPAVAGGRPRFRLFGGGFEPAAFFLGPVWFFYRKMWGFAWFVTGLIVVVGLIPGVNRLGLIVGIILAGLAHRTYVQHAIARLQRMRGSDGVLDPGAVRAAGGVSKTAGWVAGALFALLTLFALYGLWLTVKAGQPV